VASANGTVGFAYENIDLSGGGGDIDLYGINGAYSHEFDNGWLFQADGAHERADVGPVETGVSYGALNLGMRGDGHALYGFFTMTDVLASSGLGVGVGGQLYFDRATVNGSVGMTSFEDALLPDIDVTAVHVDGTWWVGENLGITGEVGWAEADFGGGGDVDWTLVGLGVSYRFTNSAWSVAAGYQYRDFDGGEADGFRVSVSMDIGAATAQEQSRSGASLNGASSLFRETRAVLLF
jgi:hypothetical protein